MEKGKNKTDLRAAGKKRLEEFRQKRQQKGSSNKPSTTTALKALTESDQTSEELYGDDSVTSEVVGNEEEQRVPNETEDDGSRLELVKESANQVKENHELQGSTTPPNGSPESCLPPPIQALKGGGHVCVETSDIDSSCQPSRKETLGDSLTEREAVDTNLWENHATNHLPQKDAWQESTCEGVEHLDDRLLNQENHSTFCMDEHHGIEKREGLKTLKSPSGVLEEALEKLHAVEDASETGPHPSSTAGTPLKDGVTDESKRDCQPDQADLQTPPSVKDEGLGPVERSLSDKYATLERERPQLVAELETLRQKLETVLDETGRERKESANEIENLKVQMRDWTVNRDYAVRTPNEELERVKVQLEKEFQDELEKADREKRQLLLELEELQARIRIMTEERDHFLSRVDNSEKQLQELRTDATQLTDEIKNMVVERSQLSEDLRAARDQVQAATKYETLLTFELRELKEDRGIEKDRLRDCEGQLQKLVEENSLLETRCNEFAKHLADLRGINRQLTDEVTESAQRLQIEEVERESLVKRVSTLEDEQLKYHALVKNLTQRLHGSEGEHQELEVLNQRFQVLEEERRHLSSFVEDLHMRRQVVEDEKAALDSKLCVLQVENTGLVTQVGYLENVISSRDMEIQELNARINSLEEENQKFITETTDLTLKIRNLEKENVDLASRASITSMLLQEMQREVAQLVRGAGEGKRERDLREAEIVEFNTNLETVNLQVQTLEQANQVLLRERDESMQKLAEENTQLAIKLNESDAVKENQSQKMAMVNLCNRNLEAEKSTFAFEVAGLKDRLQILGEEQGRLESLYEASYRLVQEVFPTSIMSRSLGATNEEQDLPSALRLMQQHMRNISEERDQLLSNLDTLNAQVKLLEVEKQQLDLKFVESEKHSSKVREDGLEVANQLEIWKEEVMKFREKLPDMERLIPELKQQLQVGSEEKSYMAENLKSMKQDLTRLEVERENSRLKTEEFRQELQESRDLSLKLESERADVEENFGLKLGVLEEKVLILEGEKLTLKRQLEGSREELDKMNGQVIKTGTEKSELERNFATEAKELQQKVRSLEVQIVELEKQLKVSGKELQHWRDQVSLLDAEKAEVMTKSGLAVEVVRLSLQTLEDEKTELAMQLKEMVAENYRVTDQLEASGHTLEKMTEERAQVESELKSSLEELKDLMEKNATLSYELRSSEQAVQQIGEEKLQAEAEVQGLQTKLKNILEERGQWSSELESSVQHVQALSAGKSELSSRVDQLLEVVTEKDQDISRLQNQLEELHQELKQSQIGKLAKMEELESNLVHIRELVNERVGLQTAVKDLERQLAEEQVQKNYQMLEEAPSPASERGSEETVTADSEEVSSSSHAALVKNLIKEFEVRASEDLPDWQPRGVPSPISKLLNQEQDTSKAADILQKERDAAIEAELATRADLETLSKKLSDTTEERATLLASFRELESNLSTSLKESSQALRDANEERKKLVNLVKQSEADHSALKSQNRKLAEKLVIAAKKNDMVVENSALISELKALHNRIEELMQAVQSEKEASEMVMKKVELLVRNLLESFFLTFPNLACTWDFTGEPIARVEDGLSYLTNEVLSEVSAKVHSLVEERDTATAANHSICEEKDILQQERESLILDIHALKAEVERKVITEAQVRVEYEQAIESIGAKLKEAQSEIDRYKDDHVVFERRLELAVREDLSLPEGVVKPPEVLDGSFEFCWTLVSLMLAESSKKLKHVQMEITDTRTELEEMLREEKSQLATSVQALEEFREIWNQEKEGLSYKVELLEVERLSLQKEKAGLTEELKGLQNKFDREKIARVGYESNIESLTFKLQDIQRELDNRKVLEAKAGAEFEQEITMLASNLHEVQSKLDQLKHDHRDFAKKLAVAVGQGLPEGVVELPEVVESSFELCWKLVNKMLQESSRKLEQVQIELRTELEEVLKEERSQYDSKVQAFEAGRILLTQEKEELAQKVKLLIGQSEEALRVLDCQRAQEQQLREALVAKDRDNGNLLLEIENLKTEMEVTLASRELDVSDLKKRIEEGTVESLQIEEHIQTLEERIQGLSDELAKAKEEKVVLQSELVQAEKRLVSTKERLTLAINKGKSVVQQRDAVKLALAEKAGELEHLISSNTKAMNIKDLALREAEMKVSALTEKAGRASLSEMELATAQTAVTSLKKSLLETRSSLQELEAAVDRITNLPEEWKSKGGVAKCEWLADTLMHLGRQSEYYNEKAEDLVADLIRMKTENEEMGQKLQDITSKCDALEKTLAKNSFENAMLESENSTLTAKASAHLKLLSDVVSILDPLQEVSQDPALISNISKPLPDFELEEAISSLVEKYTTAMRGQEEERQRATSLSKEVETLQIEKSLVVERSQSLQELLELKELELRQVNKRLDEATITTEQQEREINILVQDTERVREELTRSISEGTSFHSDRNTTEDQLLTLCERLYSALDPDSDSITLNKTSHDILMKLSICEKATELENIVTLVTERLQNRGSELQEAHRRFLSLTDTTSVLERQLDSAKKASAKLEGTFSAIKTAVEGLGQPEGPSPTASSNEWVKWLLHSLHEENQKARRATQEVESLKGVVEGVSLEVDGLQAKYESMSMELSHQRGQKEELAKHIVERDRKLQQAEKRLLAMADTTFALELELDSVKNRNKDLESAFSHFKSFADKLGSPLTPSPSECVSWFVEAFKEEQDKAHQAAEEVESLRRATNAISVEVEDLQIKDESRRAELLHQKGENEVLAENLKVMVEKFDALAVQAAKDVAEREALEAEILSLEKNSHMELSSRRLETSEAQLVKVLQESLASKELELNKYSKMVEAAAPVSAQSVLELQDKQRMSDELAERKGQVDSLLIGATKAADEKSALQSELSLMEQKLAIAREKLNLAIKKGKGLEKQRESLKHSLEEQTVKMEKMVLAQTQALQWKDSELKAVRSNLAAMADRALELESELTTMREEAAGGVQWMESQLQSLESVVSQFEFLENVVSKGPIEKIELLGVMLRETQSRVTLLEREVEKGRDSVELLQSGLRDAQERTQTLVIENANAKEELSLWVKRAEEGESRGASDRAQYENEIEAQAQALKEAELRGRTLSSRVEEMETVLQKNQSSIKSLEGSRGKAVSKLALTHNRLNQLVQQSEGLVTECENLQKNLQNRDAEIAVFKQEIERLTSEAQLEKETFSSVCSEANAQILQLKEELAGVDKKADSQVRLLREEHATLQSSIEEKTTELEQIQKQLEGMMSKGDNTVWMERTIINGDQPDGAFEEIDFRNSNGGGDWVATIVALQKRIDTLLLGTQAWRVNNEKKDFQLQNLRKDVEELSIEKASFQAGLQAKQVHIERLQTEITAAVRPVVGMQSEIEEVGPRSKWIGPGSSAAPHVRGTRRPAQSEITIDMDEEASQFLSDLDDKGHGFSALTNSGLVPKATRALADRLDGLWALDNSARPILRSVTRYTVASHEAWSASEQRSEQFSREPNLLSVTWDDITQFTDVICKKL